MVGAVVISGAAQLGAKAALFVLNVVAALAIVRFLRPAAYGDYVFALSFAAVFGLLGELGVNKVAVREMSRHPADIPSLIGTALLGQLLLAVLGCLAAQVALAFVGERAEIRAAVAIASLLYFTEAFSLSFAAVFQVRLSLQYEALARIATQALDTALVLWLISLGAGLLWLIAAPVITGAIGVAIAAGLVYWRFRTPFVVDPRRLGLLLREAVPLGITSLVVVLYLRLDSVLLGILRGPEDVGQYGAASRPIEYVILALAVLVNVLFPLLARWHGVDIRRFAALYAYGTAGLLAVSLPIVVAVGVFADHIVAVLYPADFAPAAAILRLLAPSLALTLLGAWAGFALLSARQQQVVLLCNLAALVLNIVMNFILIPVVGPMGAALAAVLTSLIVAASTTAFAIRRLAVSVDPGRSIRVLAANASIGVIGWFAVSGGWPLAGAAAMLLAYPLSLVALGAVTWTELRLVTAGLRSAMS